MDFDKLLDDIVNWTMKNKICKVSGKKIKCLKNKDLVDIVGQISCLSDIEYMYCYSFENCTNRGVIGLGYTGGIKQRWNFLVDEFGKIIYQITTRENVQSKS
jgi:hypothetical protein